MKQTELRFNGPDYDKKLDQARLTGQILRIYDLMIDEQWRTLQKIQDLTGDPQASISAQLRHLRKKRFGRNIVEKRRVFGMEEKGLFEYKLIVNSHNKPSANEVRE